LALRLVFMGTPDFAVPTLAALAGGGHDIAAVYTRAPQPAGRRGLELKPSAVACEAERLKLPVFTPKTLKDSDAADALRAHGADAAIVVAYGLILPKPILDVFPSGCFNLHASLLPRWRGPAPIHRAIMAGDTETGVIVMKLEEGLDTGPIAMAERVPIGADTTTGELHDGLKQRGAELMLRALAGLETSALQLTPQAESGATYANKIEKDETHIDWTKPWNEVHNHCRGLSPFPGAWCEFANVGRVKILHTTKGDGEGSPGRVLDDKLTVGCGSGAVRIVELQRAGGRPMAAEDFLRGTSVAPGTTLS
jgi:methionyl-tRNA formyltransferase